MEQKQKVTVRTGSELLTDKLLQEEAERRTREEEESRKRREKEEQVGCCFCDAD